jgi:hypothetical protein
MAMMALVTGTRKARNAVFGGQDSGGWLKTEPHRKRGQSARANSAPSSTKSEPAFGSSA